MILNWRSPEQMWFGRKFEEVAVRPLALKNKSKKLFGNLKGQRIIRI